MCTNCLVKYSIIGSIRTIRAMMFPLPVVELHRIDVIFAESFHFLFHITCFAAWLIISDITISREFSPLCRDVYSHCRNNIIACCTRLCHHRKIAFIVLFRSLPRPRFTPYYRHIYYICTMIIIHF